MSVIQFRFRRLSQALVFAMLFSACGVALVIWIFGTLDASAAWLRGFPIHLEAPSTSTVIQPGQTATITCKIHRLAPEPIRIVGFNRLCACIDVLGLPLELTGSGDQLTVQIQTKPTDKEGLVAYDVPLLLSIDAKQPHIPVAFYLRK